MRIRVRALASTGARLTHRPQAIPFDHPNSRFQFQKSLVVTPGALQAFGSVVLVECLVTVQMKAELNGGLDLLQVFDNRDSGPALYLKEEAKAVVAFLLEEA